MYRKNLELIGMTIEMKYKFREYVEKSRIDWIESVLEEEV
jgi:hypothetical protein